MFEYYNANIYFILRNSDFIFKMFEYYNDNAIFYFIF